MGGLLMNPTERTLLVLIIIFLIVATIATCLFMVGYTPTGGIGAW